MIGSQDVLLFLALGLLLFGAKKLPELARGLGESLKEFRKATTRADEPPPPAPPPTLPTTAGPTRRCASCQAELHADWAHCPTCGAATATPA